MTLSEIKDWQDLRIGDAIIHKDATIMFIVEAIDLKYTDHHICIQGYWLSNDELVNYQKIEIDKKEPSLFEDLIHERKSRPISEYIEKLEEKIDRLTKENERLRGNKE